MPVQTTLLYQIDLPNGYALVAEHVTPSPDAPGGKQALAFALTSPHDDNLRIHVPAESVVALLRMRDIVLQ
jgi:hypothetical protein